MASPGSSLPTAAGVFVAAFVLHNADHARRGLDEVRDGVVWGGTTVAILAAVALTLVFTRHELAPAACAVVGLSIATGVAASHLLPDWGVLSDSLPDGDVDALTWIAVLAEIGAALLLGARGLAIVRRNGYRLAAPTPRP